MSAAFRMTIFVKITSALIKNLIASCHFNHTYTAYIYVYAVVIISTKTALLTLWYVWNITCVICIWSGHVSRHTAGMPPNRNHCAKSKENNTLKTTKNAIQYQLMRLSDIVSILIYFDIIAKRKVASQLLVPL